MAIRRLRRVNAEIEEDPGRSTSTNGAGSYGAQVPADPLPSNSRRRFLTRAAAGGAIAFGASALPVGALSSASAAGAPSGSTPDSTTPAGQSGTALVAPSTATVEGNDLALVQFLQTVELAAMDAYNAILDTGRLSSPVAETARQFALHHQDHAASFASFAGNEAPNKANQTLSKMFAARITTAALDRSKAEGQLARVAFDLETGLASTHAFAMGNLDGWEIAGATSVIEPVEAQHALAWSLIVEPDSSQWVKAVSTWMPNFQTDIDAFLPANFAAT